MIAEPEAAIRLLYIDDDAGLARLVQKELGRRGHDVVCAYTAEEGLQKLADERFDVIALDHFLPGAEGLEILPQITAQPGAPPVIYVTGTQEGRVAVAALKSGAVDYVIKDVAEDFTALLRAAIDGALVRERLRRQKEAAEAEVRVARDRAEMMLREVNHRVSNSLQLVSSFIALQSRSLADHGARQALKETQSRIEAVAQVHRRLYTSAEFDLVDLSDYLGSLAQELRQSLADGEAPPDVQLQAAALKVSTDKAVSIGVIVTELVTNAVKYAYPTGGRGPIRVRLSGAQGGEGELVVEDEGVGLSDGQATGTGLGRSIISAMAASLHGAMRYDNSAPGLCARLTFQAD
jgi:two-component sensor histidine kinase